MYLLICNTVCRVALGPYAGWTIVNNKKYYNLGLHLYTWIVLM